MSKEIDYKSTSKTIKRFFTLEQWSQMSHEQQNYYLTYLSNPNHFFFRSSFLNQTPKKGDFSLEERTMFHSRFKLFRDDLKVQKIPWGYFSIPFEGRAGYQCAWFYRELLMAKEFDPDPNYPFTNGYPKSIFDENPTLLRDAVQRLEDEAYEKTKENIELVDLADYSAPPPKFSIHETVDNPYDRKEPKVGRKGRQQPTATTTSADVTDGEALFMDEIEEKKEEAPLETIPPPKVDNTPVVEEKPKSKLEILIEEVEKIPFADDNPLKGFMDPLTKTQIKEPLLDINGYVMGKKSWEFCIADPSQAPCEMSVTCLSDLIALTSDNFDSMKAFITNLGSWTN